MAATQKMTWHVDFHLTHECLGPPHSPSQTTARSLYALLHNDATKSPLVTMGRRKFCIPNCPFPFDDHHQNLIHPWSMTPLTTPNGIPIHSRILPLLTCADRQMAQANVPYHQRFTQYSDAHTHTQPFYGSVEFVRENPGEPVPEETFTHYSHRSHQSSLSAFSI